MPKLILTIGTSGSGKSSWAKDYVSKNPNSVEISRDLFRFGGVTDAKNWEEYSQNPCETYISICMDEAFFDYIKNGYDVVVSDTNLSAATRSRWVVKALSVNADIEFVAMHSHFTNLYSDPDSYMKLPSHVMEGQYQRYLKFLEEAPRSSVKYTFV